MILKFPQMSTFFLVSLTLASTVCSANAAVSENEFLEMDISQLMQVTITSVAKKPQSILDASAAVFVITRDDIHSSGVTSIPEALRMAPGLQVARIGASKWAISSRGFNGYFSNKLLVMIDGRTVYSPSFSGTYWDMQNTLLEDIERIEVIRGPGATMWGANAVNGVINIITRNSADTVGGLATVGAGNKEQFLSGFRYGAALNESVHGRLYMTYNQHDSFTMWDDETDAYDSWKDLSAGFRLDGEHNKRDSWTVQGGVYGTDEKQAVEPFYITEPPFITTSYGSVDSRGFNLLGRWERKLSATDALKFQSYYDFTEREESYGGQLHKTVDVDLQYEKLVAEINNLTLGIGYRNISTTFDPSFQIALKPTKRSDDLYSGFIQDVITLVPDTFWLTLGAKWEYNNYTGNEIQPTGRVMWQPSKSQAVWGSISRAVRTPSQFDRGGSITLGLDLSSLSDIKPYSIKGSSSFGSEEVIAYESGYRWYPLSNLFFDIAFFYNDYSNLRAARQDSDPEMWYNSTFVNGLEGSTYGGELLADWQANDWLKFIFTYTFLNLDIEPKDPLYGQGTADIDNGSAPQHQLALRSMVDLYKNWQANLWLRYVSELDKASSTAKVLGLKVDEYFECDLNLTWKPTDNIELMLVGQNLLNSRHLEFVSEFYMVPIEVERSVYLKVLFHF